MADKHGQGDDALAIGSLGHRTFQEWLDGQKFLHGHAQPGMPDWLHEFYATCAYALVTSFTNIAAPKSYIPYAYDSITTASIINRYHASPP